jgi:hypothetical protein
VDARAFGIGYVNRRTRYINRPIDNNDRQFDYSARRIGYIARNFKEFRILGMTFRAVAPYLRMAL